MDYGHGCVAEEKRRVVSVLHGDELFFNRVISRNPSVGYSSRVFYYRSGAEGVPFQWEMQPGTPKVQPKEESIPPLSPPPALLSLGLPKPCIDVDQEVNRVSLGSRLKFWRRSKKTKKTQRGSRLGSRSENAVAGGGGGGGCDAFERFEFCSSDGEFMTWSSPRNSSTSSSSSSMSFSNGDSRQSSRLESPARDSIQGIHACSPWNLSSILVSVARRV
ncbi:uncharacterized protein LOC110600609 [Manihot esculenta]|uniref:Uncharacterized protein n=1 Tax=Manihot esculenta TaxID=3983 RepID=A0A2C9UM32_MANES|nr:uncharacterized protein LOC110600609 [Manihot esculenta]OAY31946.1 hypothetical protein MANES_14G154200v8 [Manihot esculenta]